MKVILRTFSVRDWLLFFFCFFIMIVEIAFEMKAPEYSQQIAESISNGTATYEFVKHTSWIVFGIGVCASVCAILNALSYSKLSASLGTNLRQGIFNRVCTIKSDEVNRITVGGLITRSNNDVAMVQFLVLSILQVGINAPFTATWAIIKIQTVNNEWTVAMTVCTAVMCVLILITVALTYSKMKRLRVLEDEFNTDMQQGIEGVRVIRAFGVNSFWQKKTGIVNKNMTKTSFAISRYLNLLNPAVSACRNAMSIAIYIIGASLMMRASFAGRSVIMGNMSAFAQYSLQIISAFTSLVSIIALFPEAFISLKRINELYYNTEELEYPKKSKAVECRFGEVELSDVSFTYKNASAPSIRHINLKINPGEKFAITGPTGCGKTTLLNIIRRLNDADNGSVIANGNNVKSYTENQLAGIFSFSPQRSMIFAGNIGFNICYGKDFELEAAKRAFQTAKIDFLDDNQLNMEVSQNGINFSGGQRQRISVARALYRKANVYIFDDSFSAIDVETDMAIQKAIRKNYPEETVITVSQRISTLMNYDRIAVMNEGRIIDIGTHEELLSRCALYGELVKTQKSEEGLI